MPDKDESKNNAISILNDLPCATAILEGAELYDAAITFLNQEMCSLTGYTKDEIMLAGAEQIFRVIDDELPDVLHSTEHDLRANNTTSFFYRMLCKHDEVKLISAHVKAVPLWAGRQRYYLTLNDVTVQMQQEKSVRQTAAMYNMATLNNDICVFEYNIATDTLYHSTTSLKVHGARRRVVRNLRRVVVEEGWLKKSSIPEFLALYDRLAGGAATASADLWVRDRGGNGWWCERVAYTNIFDDDGNIIRTIGVGKNITEEFNLRAASSKLSVALKNANVVVWEYDIVNGTAKSEQGFFKNIVLPEVVYNMPRGFAERGLIAPESVDDFYRLHSMVQCGHPQAEAEIKIKDLHGRIVWLDIKYNTIFDDSGKPVRAIGSAKDISDLKEMEQRYFDELKYQENSQSKKLVGKIRVNISTNRLEYYMVDTNVRIQTQNSSWDEILGRLLKRIVNEKQRQKLLTILSRDFILQNVGEKVYNSTFECQWECNDGNVMWMSLVCRVYRSPDTNEIICFCYCYDITVEKMKQLTFNRIMQMEYDELGVIDLQRGNLQLQQFSPEQDEPKMQQFANYDAFVCDYIQREVAPDEKAQGLLDCSLKMILGGLEKHNIYCASFGITINGQPRRKKVQYTYLDDAKRFILLARSDITELFQNQKQRQEILRSALLQAQQASVAKSEFLSRVSHEIRTPMNAIIGMTALAEEATDNPAELADCLNKVQLSARFLLDLINDILDMSRIESGRVVLKNEKFSFEELLRSINVICGEQALRKGVRYESQLRTFVGSYYVGDAMKLQQVLVNIIFNAIKFTSAGGNVQLVVSQESCSDGRAQLQFTISDTGIGISEDFLPHLFEPFEQENAGITSQYGGTGLGLAICKNLVDLMNGSIDVHSITGVGTQFIVTVTLGALPDERPDWLPQQASFVSCHALIVDDVIADCERIKHFCEDFGIKADWVDSGAKAVDRVRRKMIRQEFYDLVLVDWKMPEMNGAETVRCIRRVLGDEVPIVIISAYDQAEIEPLARQAGADLFLTKPLFKESFAKVIKGLHNRPKDNDVVMQKPPQYDFTGRRVLLVEDHQLNIEVAKRLLTAKNMTVEVAMNGLAAIEMFVKQPNGYYDAILMDIRMPLMDGLTAAKTIRHTSHPYALTVPIIAMSANAFDEDIEKSRAAGMNAHLSKPINPAKLYHVLNSFISCRDDSTLPAGELK